MTRKFLALATLSACTLSAPAFAWGDETIVSGSRETTSRAVSYTDLNLANASDVAALKSRVRRAAEALCVDNRVRDVTTIAHGITCRNDAIERAEPQIASAIARAGSAIAVRTISVSRSAE